MERKHTSKAHKLTSHTTHHHPGFEALTIVGGGALGLDHKREYVVTTTEYKLWGAAPGTHWILAWDAAYADLANPRLPSASRPYAASRVNGKPLGVASRVVIIPRRASRASLCAMRS